MVENELEAKLERLELVRAATAPVAFNAGLKRRKLVSQVGLECAWPSSPVLGMVVIERAERGKQSLGWMPQNRNELDMTCLAQHSVEQPRNRELSNLTVRAAWRAERFIPAHLVLVCRGHALAAIACGALGPARVRATLKVVMKNFDRVRPRVRERAQRRRRKHGRWLVEKPLVCNPVERTNKVLPRQRLDQEMSEGPRHGYARVMRHPLGKIDKGRLKVSQDPQRRQTPTPRNTIAPFPAGALRAARQRRKLGNSAGRRIEHVRPTLARHGNRDLAQHAWIAEHRMRPHLRRCAHRRFRQ
eukprot:Amastigsp_a341120_13.p2 type:complete len:301 gc:universal Amastigsp_a341120_13:1130-228(-)